MTDHTRRRRRILTFATHGSVSFLIEVALLLLFAALAVGFAAIGLWIS